MNYYRQPISIARGKGMYLWDIEGEQYLDIFTPPHILPKGRVDQAMQILDESIAAALENISIST